MRVLLANSPFGGGGITTYATQLIDCLSSDTELTIVLGDDKKAPITNPRVRVIYHDTMSLTFDNALFFINLINNELKPDVVIVSAAIIIPIVAPYLNNRIKVITVSHSGRFFFTKYSALNHNYVDGIIAASSDYNKQYLERHFHIKDNNKIKVIYNFVADDKELEELRFNKKNNDPITIVYAGASSVHKSPELVSEIVSELLKTDLDFKFYWTGKTNIPLTTTILKHSKLKDVRQILPEDSRLFFPGRIPDKRDYDFLLGSANIFLAPSKNEGCSMALLEAHRSGCIMLVADYKNSNREIVAKGNSGFVIDHKDASGFVDIIRLVITTPSKYNYLYENSHSVFKTMLSYPVWSQKIMDVLNNSPSHRRRHNRVSRMGLFFDIWRMKYLEVSSTLEQFFSLSLPSYLSFIKQFRGNKRTSD